MGTPKDDENKGDEPKTPAAPGANEVGGETATAALAELAANYVPPVGIPAALDFLRKQFDEEAHVLWTANGARKTRQSEIAGILCEVGGQRRVIIVIAMESGTFKLYGEVPGKDAETVEAMVRNFYAGPQLA